LTDHPLTGANEMTAIAMTKTIENTFIYLFENNYDSAWQRFSFRNIDFVINVTATTCELIAWDSVTETMHYADNVDDAKSIIMDAIIERG
jgi:hypothetical protein